VVDARLESKSKTIKEKDTNTNTKTKFLNFILKLYKSTFLKMYTLNLHALESQTIEQSHDRGLLLSGLEKTSLLSLVSSLAEQA
jgi:hypothetical protein